MTRADADPLERFVEAQKSVYATALGEICSGTKRSHWMWFIFPQLYELGRSATARHFGIRSIEEAQAYLDHPLLGSRYNECVKALQQLGGHVPEAVFGTVDAMKLRSSLTLFEAARPLPLFAATLECWFGGERDDATLQLLRARRP